MTIAFSTIAHPPTKDVLPLENSMPHYHFDPAYGYMFEDVPAPYWKAAKQRPPTEIIQTAMNKWFVEGSNADGDGYVVQRIYYAPQNRIRWICSCHDFLVRRQGTEHPWCKHIYHVYDAFHTRSPEQAWIQFPFPDQAAKYIVAVCEKKPELADIFWEDLIDLHGQLAEESTLFLERLVHENTLKNSVTITLSMPPLRYTITHSTGTTST